jgi:hypothetical protein
MEARCAYYGSDIVKNKEKSKDPKRLETITRNALGVMREEGLFAFYLYLKYRGLKNKADGSQEDEGGHLIWNQVKALWQDQAVGPLLSGDGDDRQQVIRLTENLNDLLLAREVAGRALVYALYGLRAESEK